MRGREVITFTLSHGGSLAALMEDGVPVDLLFDPAPGAGGPGTGAIFRARPERPAKGLGGMMLDLGRGQRGFLREIRGVAPGRPLLVQVLGHAEPGKAVPVTPRLVLKGRHAILTPGVAGLNVARRLDPGRAVRLEDLAVRAMAGAEPGLGLILRSAAALADDDVILNEIKQLRGEAQKVAGAKSDEPGPLLPAPSALDLARREWPEAPWRGGSSGELADLIEGVRENVTQLAPGGTLVVEATRALIAADVNTGGDFAPAASLRSNLAAARDLPRVLRLRGLGGKVVIDFAALARNDRKTIENALKSALRDDPVETSTAGWTPLGLLELNRRRERRPLSELVL
jgi:Ribonuclease G/E